MKPAVLVLLAVVACGGTPSTGDSSGPLLPADDSTATVSPQVAKAASPSFCDSLCNRMLGCLSEAMEQAPTDAERRSFGERCPARCEAQSPASLDAAQACLEARDDSCPELVSCLDHID